MLALAQSEAQRLDHNYIGTEHLLLGLVGDKPGVAARVLAALGVGLTDVRAEVESIVGRGAQPIQGEIKLTPRLKKVLELAVSEARIRKQPGVASAHLLLGLLGEGKGIGVDVLTRLGVSHERAQDETLRLLSPTPPP